MIIGILSVELDIPGAFSLKDKRMVLNRIRERTRARFNVAVAEVEQQDVWNHACIAVVTVSNQQQRANQTLSKVIALIEAINDCVIADISMEFI